MLVNGSAAKASLVLRGGETIEVSPAGLPPLKATPEDLPVEVLYEDASLIAVNKPAGLAVHAGAGLHEGTLVNRLVHRFGALSQLGGEMRPGIVHRLDKDTSGVLLVARTDAAHRALAAQFAGRTVEKIYLALVHGKVRADSGRITKPIARDPVRRTRMTARLESGREALTEYKVRKRFEKFTFLEVRIGTGRTHQIRVHLASIGHPVAGDRVYGRAIHAQTIVPARVEDRVCQPGDGGKSNGGGSAAAGAGRLAGGAIILGEFMKRAIIGLRECSPGVWAERQAEGGAQGRPFG